MMIVDLQIALRAIVSLIPNLVIGFVSGGLSA